VRQSGSQQQKPYLEVFPATSYLEVFPATSKYEIVFETLFLVSRRVAQHRRYTRRAVSRCCARILNNKLRSILEAWHQHTQLRLSQAKRCKAVLARRTLLQMEHTLRAWREVTSLSAEELDSQTIVRFGAIQG
jgi:hypothetical protein